VSRCAHCGGELGTHTLDIGFSLPDVVWALKKEERELRARSNSDLCELDKKRFFVRAIAFIPITETEKRFGWGLWAEVDAAAFERYLRLYEVDARGEPAVSGRIANSIRGYPSLEGHPVDVVFGTASERPTLTLHLSPHPLSLEQRKGISIARVHEINAIVHGEKG
jgi:hypothetical protein